MGLQSPTDFVQSPCTAALYGKRLVSSTVNTLLRFVFQFLAGIFIYDMLPGAYVPDEANKNSFNS